jgi:hypothetical protein
MDEAGLKAEAKFFRRLLEIKFGPLPNSAQQLLNRASESDLERWGERMMKVDNLEAVFADE